TVVTSVHILFAYTFVYLHRAHRHLPSFPTRRSSDLPPFNHTLNNLSACRKELSDSGKSWLNSLSRNSIALSQSIRCSYSGKKKRSEEHTSELQSRENLVCRLLLEKKKIK